ncbi:MAG: CinA family nicotinamide mononucleotide deamidase-related protein [Saprospiraceae bacterium]|nr:CinA family nicotinamide mononucleotide deamidase-related protein [Saprospiraceae bacterium]
MVASFIAIGDELLIGKVVDTNSVFIAQKLSELGIQVIRRWTVGDTNKEILYALGEASSCCDLVFITGGLGPTKDDITKKSLSEYFNVELVFSESNLQHLKEILSQRGIGVKEAHLTQCYIPSNAQLLNNKLGTALGLWMEHRGKLFISMPGVPDEMQYILMHEVIPRIRELKYGNCFLSKTFHTCGIGETDIAEKLEKYLHDYLSQISIAYLPSIAQVKFRISVFGDDEKSLRMLLNQCEEKVRLNMGHLIFGEDDTSISQELGFLLIKSGLTLGTVESCTGGEIASKITSISGSSSYYKGSIVCYATELKEKLLNIDSMLIEEYSVYSKEVAEAMVRHSIDMLNTDLVISSTGIAGPDGGTEKLKVGTIFIACGNKQRVRIKKLMLGKNRDRNIEAASILALNLAREWILEKS